MRATSHSTIYQTPEIAMAHLGPRSATGARLSGGTVRAVYQARARSSDAALDLFAKVVNPAMYPLGAWSGTTPRDGDDSSAGVRRSPSASGDRGFESTPSSAVTVANWLSAQVSEVQRDRHVVPGNQGRWRHDRSLGTSYYSFRKRSRPQTRSGRGRPSRPWGRRTSITRSSR
jgi:hypothetical protein